MRCLRGELVWHSGGGGGVVCALDSPKRESDNRGKGLGLLRVVPLTADARGRLRLVLEAWMQKRTSLAWAA